MVRDYQSDICRALNAGFSWVVKDERSGLVLTPTGLVLHDNRLWSTPGPRIDPPPVSIVICTYDRLDSLNETLASLATQTFKDFEVLLLTEKGDLSVLRDRGLRWARGSIVSFIDDDVHCPPTWLESVVKCFGEGVVGVTGPTVIEGQFKKARDSIRYEKLRRLHDWLFQVPSHPSALSPCGAPSMASNFEGCLYEGPAQYLECCNMSVKKEEAINVGGFDHNYIRTGEWCELDLALRLGARGRNVYKRECLLYHRPSQEGIYRARLSTLHRWDNFKRFQRRWIKPSPRKALYQAFVWTYFKLKGHGIF